MNEYTFNESDARQFYKWLRHGSNEFTEVRVIEWNPEGKGASTQFFVNNEEDFISVCKEWNGIRQVYAGCNPRCQKSGTAKDVKRVTVFPFDIDGPTPDKRRQAATEKEVMVAEGWKDDLVIVIKEQFGIEPYVDFSGNGYRVCLPCDIEVTNQQNIDAKLKIFFAEYKEKLKLPDFDNISDLPRIIKVPGVWSLKGKPTEKRPHRQAKLIQIGDLTKIKEISDYILSLEAPKKQAVNKENIKDPKDLNPIKLTQLRPCFLDFINNPARNRVCYDKSKASRDAETGMRKALAKELYSAKFTEEEMLSVCSKFDDYNHDKSLKEIGYVLAAIKTDPDKNKPFTCKSILNNGGCLGEQCQYYKHKILGEEKESKEVKYPTYAELFPWNTEEDKPAPFKPAKVAQWLHDNDNFKTDEKTDMLYFGESTAGKWSSDGDTQLRKIVTKILGEEDRESHYRNILHTLKSLTYSDIVFSNKIAMENCLYNPETQETSPFSLSEMAFYAIPVFYNKNVDKSKLDNWLEFLKQVANPDDIPLLQEWFGYCFLPDYRFHKVLWIHGEGRNGKGVFDRTIKGLLGSDNYSTVGLERLDGTQRFVLKDLYGKLYNSSSEPVSNKIFQTEIFQKITGSDAIDAEFKNANKEKRYVNAAKLTVIGNKFPRINNPTTAFKDRMMFTKFSHHFDDSEQIQNLENVWLNDPEQRSAIFNWAMEGLQRLLSQTHFSVTKTQKETEIMFNRVTDNITAFQLEIGILDKNLATRRAEALTAYQEYCEVIGVEPRRSSQFTQGMLRLAPRVKDGWIYKPKKERAWLGFGLKNREQQSIEQMEQTEQQNILSNFSDNFLENKKDKTGVPSVLSVPSEVKESVLGEKYKNRYCSVECKNFDKPTCTAPNWRDLNKKSLLPLKCPGYSYVGTGEDF